MDEMKFTWDEEKAKANVRKHHVSFEEASSSWGSVQRFVF